jgi:hypothetical protein
MRSAGANAQFASSLTSMLPARARISVNQIGRRILCAESAESAVSYPELPLLAAATLRPGTDSLLNAVRGKHIGEHSVLDTVCHDLARKNPISG